MIKDELGNEILEEEREPIKDQICKLFLQLWDSMANNDQVTANKRLKSEGLFKRIADIISFAKNKDNINSNIFVPSRALQLIQHLKEHIQDHSLILADFDSFIMPRNSIIGINAPLVTHKLRDPT